MSCINRHGTDTDPDAAPRRLCWLRYRLCRTLDAPLLSWREISWFIWQV